MLMGRSHNDMCDLCINLVNVREILCVSRCNERMCKYAEIVESKGSYTESELTFGRLPNKW